MMGVDDCFADLENHVSGTPFDDPILTRPDAGLRRITAGQGLAWCLTMLVRRASGAGR
jgi:hypothetical protein